MNSISRILSTITVTAPTFLSLGLIGMIKENTQYFHSWKSLICCEINNINIEWWCITISLLFAFICFIGIKIYLSNITKKTKEVKTITVKSYENISYSGTEQLLTSIIPWLTLSVEQIDYKMLFFCVLIQCSFTVIACYRNNGFNLLCSMWGYRYYKVYTEENTYILLSNKCIRNKNEISRYIELTDYDGIIITNKNEK